MNLNRTQQIKTKSSTVIIGDDNFKSLSEFLLAYTDQKIFVLVDENTHKHCLTPLITNVDQLKKVEIIEVESGEENKVLEVCYQLWKTLSENNADRKSLLINLGGGVITDMGGFVASTYKRGIDFVNIPTTLLSQIDASVGGKVGVDFEGLKNMVGVFKEPQRVFINPNFLTTLDKRQMLSGYAEALKHALIKDSDYWNALKKGMLFEEENWQQLISTSVHIKNDIVTHDFEEQGERKLLNFGHTVGHAIETFSLLNDKDPLFHGEAVAIGMICEAYIATKEANLSVEELDEITKALLVFYPKYELDNTQFDYYIELMKKDKKNENNTINCTLLNKIGEGVINHQVSVENIVHALHYYINL